MSCNEVKERLQDYLDGELSGELAAGLRDHLGYCLDCRRESVIFRELREEARGLDAAVEPSEDLWPAIARRIDPGAASQTAAPVARFRLWALAATLAALFLGAFVLRHGTQAPPEEETFAQVAEDVDLGLIADQARVESGVIQMRKDLLGELDRRRDELAPETWNAIEASLAELDQAIGEIHLALEEHPDDQQLNHLLASQYRRELDFLRRIARA